MRVLQILPELNFGGVEIGTVDMSKQLRAHGHHPYVISAGGKLVGELQKLGITHIELPVHKKSLASFFLVPKIREIIRRERIDIVHARSRIPAWIAYFATRNTDACFLTSCHGFYSEHMLSRIMGWGKYVIVISNAVGRRMIDTFGVPAERIRLVHRGIDLTQYTYGSKRFMQKKKEKFIIANIARITPLKGHKVFLEAIRLAKMKISNIEVWLIGSAGKKQKYFEELKALIEKFGLVDSVTFLGACKDIPQLLQKVDLLVLSTTVPEGFGRVLVEAGASGVPVLATKLGGVLDIIEDGRDGTLVAAHDPYEMSGAIEKILSSYPEQKLRVEHFRAKIEKQFTLERMARNTIAVYDEAIRCKRILVIKLGALGDLILIIPSLRALREKYPSAFISLLVDNSLVALVEHCPYIDEVITFNRNKRKRFLKRFLKLTKQLRKKNYDISVDFQNNKWTHLLAYLSDVQKRYGFIRGVCGRFLTSGVQYKKEQISPIEQQQQLLNVMGITNVERSLELWVTKFDEERISKQCMETWEEQTEAPVVGFVLRASPRWSSKSWPLEHFISLAQLLHTQLNAKIILIGDSENKSYAERFMLATDADTLDLVGKTSIREMVAVIKHVDFLVASDTAPIHVASAVGTHAVALFGPTDPLRHAPPGKHIHVLKKHLPCAPCYKRNCTTHTCMKDIQVQDVFEIIQRHCTDNGVSTTQN